MFGMFSRVNNRNKKVNIYWILIQMIFDATCIDVFNIE